MNRDIIYRQAAIDAVTSLCDDCDSGYCGDCRVNIFVEGGKHVRKVLEDLPSAQPAQQWIPCSERMPECEQEVLICTKIRLVGKDAYIDSIITPALYEDGTMLENESKWHWEDVDYEKWDEEEDCGVIPEGWWENRHFNPDDVYNNVVDREVVAWMPLPKPYAERREE